MLRYSIGKKTLHMWIKGYKFLIYFTFLAVLGIITLLLDLFTAVVVLVGGLMLLFLWIAVEKKSLRYAAIHIISMAFRWPFFIIGFLEKPRKPADYPTNVNIIKHHEG